MRWPFVSRALYTNVLRQLAAERRRADDLLEALFTEREDNRRAERHWANQFLRKQNAFGMADKQPAERVATPAEPLVAKPFIKYDSGELTALIEEAKRHGLSEQDAKAFFMKEKNIDVLM